MLTGASGIGRGGAQLAHFGFWSKRVDVRRLFMGRLPLFGHAMQAHGLRGVGDASTNRTCAVIAGECECSGRGGAGPDS